MRSFLLSLLVVCSYAGNVSLDSVDEFTITLGQIANVTLKSNPSTGYSWTLIDPKSEKLKVADFAGEYEAAQTGLIGASGVQVFRISCSEACNESDIFKLIFEHKRIWEASQITLKTVTAKVEANHDL